MAYYSKETKLTNLPMVSKGAGTLSKDSYVLTEVTKIVAHDGYSDVTFKHSLYGKSTKQRSVKAELGADGSVSKTVTVTTSFTSLLTLTETVKCYDSIDTNVSGTLTYSDSSVIRYGITTDPDVFPVKIRFVTFGKVSSYPYSMKYGETGTVTMDKSSDYRLEYYDTSGIKRYTVSFSGTSVDVTIPITVFQETGGNLTTMKCFEEAQGIDICEVDYPCSVSETACSIGISAVRSSTDADPSLVTLTLVGKSAASSTSRTVTIYAKETSASDWTTIGTISPAASSFTETFTADLAIDYAWDIYATISDGYTSAESTKVRIYSRSYIMDVRTDGKGIAFGGTAANADEMYCGFDTFRANKISAGNITASGTISDSNGNLRSAIDGKANTNHTHSISDITDLAKRFQAGYVNITPGSATKTFNGVKYYEGTATVTFDPAFDSEPSISLVPSTSVPYKMALGASNVSKTGFTIEFFRDSKTGAGIHWTAMPRTQ